MSKRQSPSGLFPEAKSVIVLGLPYPKPNNTVTLLSKGEGKVASYAWGKDYHLMIPRLHGLLMDSLQSKIKKSITWKGFTDSAPILERDFGVRAGLGWIGKNGCLISPQHGSTFLLSEIFCDLVIESDAHLIQDHCRACTRCLNACPTQCILTDRTIDASRCISYLTIEHKGVFSEDQETLIEDWGFGCDICQTVCPWNQRFADVAGHPDLSSEEPHRSITLTLLESLDDTSFRKYFLESPLLRPKLSGLRRNLLAVEKNQKR